MMSYELFVLSAFFAIDYYTSLH